MEKRNWQLNSLQVVLGRWVLVLLSPRSPVLWTRCLSYAKGMYWQEWPEVVQALYNKLDKKIVSFLAFPGRERVHAEKGVGVQGGGHGLDGGQLDPERKQHQQLWQLWQLWQLVSVCSYVSTSTSPAYLANVIDLHFLRFCMCCSNKHCHGIAVL